MTKRDLPNPFALLWQQFRVEWRLYARDRGAMFWSFLFPLLMLFAFGVIFRSGGPPALTLVRVAPAEVSARDRAFVQALEESHLKIVTLPAEEAEERWAKGQTTAQLESVGDGYRLRLNSYLIAQGQVAAQAASQAYLVAQARLNGSPVLGTATFLAMGFALSSLASTIETYAPISNLVFFPMMLLSGVYFRLDNAPQWMQKAVFILPLSPYLRMLRAVFNDGATLAGHSAGLAIVGAWAMLSFVLAVKRFRWV